MKIVQVASKSEIKLQAVREALAEIFPIEKFDVHGVAVDLQAREDLDVNAQPLGHDTRRYALWRLQEMQRIQPVDADLYISIENGIFRDSGGYSDRAIVVFAFKRVIHIFESAEVRIPGELIGKLFRQSLKTTTIGDVIHGAYPHIPAKDWQRYFGHLTRLEQIKNTVVEGLLYITGQGES